MALNKDQEEITSRLIESGMLPSRNWFAQPYIAESKAVFVEYCEKVLDIDKNHIGKIVKKHFDGKIKVWTPRIAFEALTVLYEDGQKAFNKKLYHTYWEVPSICPVCGGVATPHENFNFVSKPYHKAYQCTLDGKLVANNHFTWPTLVRLIVRQENFQNG